MKQPATEIGREGEDLAEIFLEKKGFKIMHRNWRSSHYEIDIVAIKGEILHFVEVKRKSSRHFGPPEEKVTRTKFRSLTQAARAFLYRNPHKLIRFDILSILTLPGREPEYFFIEDVYFG